jgi:hypothetical protein
MPFSLEPTALDDVKVVVPERFPDGRGFFHGGLPPGSVRLGLGLPDTHSVR